MARFDGSAALKLDFGTTPRLAPDGARSGQALRLASSGAGPDKYKMLEHRRRQAQIKARRLLELLEEAN
jgi:hypothetical protein